MRRYKRVNIPFGPSHPLEYAPPPSGIYIIVGLGCTDAVQHFMYIGVGVGWQRRCKTCQSLRELDNQGTVFFLAVTVMVTELNHIVRGGEP